MRTKNEATHPTEAERSAVEAMYHRLDRGVADALERRRRMLAAPAEGPQELYARDVAVAGLARAVSELRAAERSLCFGRIDSSSGDSVHIGRTTLRDEDGGLILADWRADAARPFYAATPAAALGLRRRRHIRLDRRRVIAVSDEILDGSPPTTDDLVGDSPLVEALGAARTGRMHEAVATLQAQQDEIVRSAHRGVVVVDGGPGTGKTIVALHRAAYVLYAFPALAERGVLVFGPNHRFLDYISEVLPSLGENDVRMATLADIAGIEPSTAESEAAARIKGRVELATALAGWVRDQQPHGVPFDVTVGQHTLHLAAAKVDDARRSATHGGLAHNPAREIFKEHLVAELVDLLEKRTVAALTEMDEEVAALMGFDIDQAVADDLHALGFDDEVPTDSEPAVDWESVRSELLEDPGLDVVIEAIWPRLDAKRALRRFLADAGTLAERLPGFSEDEIALLTADDGSGPTLADLALEDELRALVDGPPEAVFGHIVIDEAQELSEMQWRMLMRRCPSRSLTVVGDLAQAGAATTIRSWHDALAPFAGERFEHHTLTVNYRTTAEVLEAAAPLLARIAPAQRTSRSIRHGEPPRPVSVDASAVETTVLELVQQIASEHPDELIGVICPDEQAAGLRAALAGTDAAVVAATEARGLEFDSVVVVDPSAIEAGRSSGIRDLYVAVTRATKRLCTVSVK